MMSTREIVTTYDVTRQTLNNWVQREIISKPTKQGNKNLWSEKNIIEIEKVISKKNEQNTLFEIEHERLKISNRRYLGSKQRMLKFIDKVVRENTYDVKSVADIFGGTGVVADLFQSQGKEIIVNDILFSNAVSYNTWFGTQKVNYKKIKDKIFELNSLNGTPGYVTENFGNRYFSEENAKKIDSIREKIEDYSDLNKREHDFLLTSLLYAMDKSANTVGHFDAYRKKMDSLKPIVLRVPEQKKTKKSQIFNMDANQLVKIISADLIYIDTPYNSRGYESAYHVLENVAEWKKPDVEGIAKKAVNRSEKSSDYTKNKAPQAFDDLIQNISARYILVSFNNMAHKGNSRSNAKISNEEILESLNKRGNVEVFSTDFNVFTTGKSKIANHKELLYLCKINS
ncbi:DNA adenine methylase [Lactococcus garvieae]|uniref:DNA adenine methylase n=1 Tax=Lactococcus TaxID=1357 RepID=UPI00254DEDC7|nr:MULTISPECIES: DNA adenine methylase [Lactococcus]